MNMVPYFEVQDRSLFAFTSAPFLLCLASALALSLPIAFLTMGPLATRGIVGEE